MDKGLPRHARVVNQLFPHPLAEAFMLRQGLRDIFPIRQLGGEPARMRQYDALVALIDTGILNNAERAQDPCQLPAARALRRATDGQSLKCRPASCPHRLNRLPGYIVNATLSARPAP